MLTNSHRLLLITGGAAGIGLAVLRRYISAGWNVLCHYHSSEVQAETVRDECAASGADCELIRADLSNEAGIAHLLERINGKAVDCLVNNAGAYIVQKHYAELDFADLSASFAVNLAAPFLLASRVFSGMCQRGYGRIVNVSSIAAKYGGSPLSMHYGCFKRGMEGITRTLSRAGAEYGVLVNTVRPGVIDTPFHGKYPKDMQARIQMIPSKRMGSAEEVAEFIHFLGSDLNTYVTGETVAVSGGE